MLQLAGGVVHVDGKPTRELVFQLDSPLNRKIIPLS